jgi:hypothetical protein
VLAALVVDDRRVDAELQRPLEVVLGGLQGDGVDAGATEGRAVSMLSGAAVPSPQ